MRLSGLYEGRESSELFRQEGLAENFWNPATDFHRNSVLGPSAAFKAV